ncbi:P-loop containing nucleoside triphosphate hydrolase [Phytophthora cactorum]|nr:P-loop containing nucleoside triphosphate hydrolase [Phytophthora cactorum]
MRIESERRTLPVLRALVVKNWTVKRRHPFATWSEVLNPLLCILLFVALKRFEPDVMVPAGWATSDVNESASAYGSTWNLYATTDVESALNEDLSNSLQIPRFYFTETTMPGLLLSLSLQALMEGNNLAELGEEGLMDCALKFLLFGYTGAERTTYHVPNACKGKVVPYKIAITPDTPYTREYFAAALETWYPRIALAPPVKGISLLTIPSFADSHVFFDNETALEAYVTSEEYGTEVQYPKIYGAIAFEEFPQDISTFGDLEGYSIAYTLRFNSTGSVSAVPKTKKPRPNTISKFVPAENTMKYATRGFMTLQTVVARFLNCMPIWDAQSETTNGTCQVDQAVMAANAENDRRLLEQLEKDMIIGTAFTLLNTVKDLITSIASVTLPNVSVDTIPPLSVERLLVPLRMAPQSYHGAGVYGTPTQAFRYAPFFDKIAVDTELFAGWVLAYLPILLLGAMLQTFGAHGLLFPNSDTKLLFLFFFTFATSSFSYGFMISSLFSRARAGSLAGMGLFFIMFFLSYSFSDDTSEASRTCAALLPPISLSQGIGVIAKLESFGVGVNHDNASEDVNNFRFANAIGMQILDTVLYILLGKYFEKVVPQEFGVAEKWYVFLTKGYWCPQSSKLVSTEEIGGMSATYNDTVEAVRQELETQENSGRAITCLLGHNGAGKTTVMSMLTGMTRPSSGNAWVRGHSVVTDMRKIRRSLGYCPQHSVLYPDLTVKEHLTFYGRLKGFTNASELAAEVIKKINEVGLADKTNVRSHALSGGMQRKLSLAIAFLGDSTVVFLDEPTAGMDPYSRRTIIASDVGTELTFQLPFEASAGFPELFRELESHQAELGILSFAISVTTLEEIFLKVAESGSAEVLAKESREDRADTNMDAGAISTVQYSLAQRTTVPFGCPDPNGDGNTAWCSELVEPPYFLEGAAYELEIDATVYSASTTPTVFGVSYDSPAIEPNDSTGYNLRLAELVFEKGYGYTSDANMTALPTQASVEGQFGGYLLYASESTNTMSYNVLANGSSTHAAPTYKHMIDNAIHRSYLSFPAVIFIVIAFTFIPASMMPYIVKEKHLEQNAKYQQLLSGMSFFAYWLSNFIFDVALYLVPMAATLLLLRSYGVTKSLSSGDTCDSCTQDVPAAMVTLFVLFGTAIAPWTYLLSHVMEKPSECLLYTVMINFFLGLLLLLLSFTMNSLDSTRPANEVLVYIWRCSPLFAFGNGFLNVLMADLLALFGLTSTPRSAFDADVAGTDIWYLLIECPLFLLLTVGIDVVQAGTVRWRIAQFMDKINNARRMYTRVPCTNTKLHIQQKCVGGKVIESENIDSDVAAEARRVQESYNSLAASSEVVQIFELEKVYPNGKRAVKCLSFGLQQGECYGFLGVNGAGKTTTMKVLTGDLLPTSGTATINGFDICKERSKARDSIGYCPQFDALIDLLTVREHLELFGRFKGFDTTDRLKKEVDRLLNKLQIQSFANKLQQGWDHGGRWSALLWQYPTLKSRFGDGFMLECKLDLPPRHAYSDLEQLVCEHLQTLTSQGDGIQISASQVGVCSALGNATYADRAIASFSTQLNRGNCAVDVASFCNGWLLEDSVQRLDKFLHTQFNGVALIERQADFCRYKVTAPRHDASNDSTQAQEQIATALSRMFEIVEARKAGWTSKNTACPRPHWNRFSTPSLVVAAQWNQATSATTRYFSKVQR